MNGTRPHQLVVSAIRGALLSAAHLIFGLRRESPTSTNAFRSQLLTADIIFAQEGEDAEVKRVGPRAPNMNAYAERWVQTLRQECLDHFLVLGAGPLGHLVKEFVAQYNEERPHQAKDNMPLPEADEPEPRILKFPAGAVKCRERLGGLLKHYYRDAA